MAQCTAKSKRSGAQCKRAAMVGKTKCYMHGGATPAGPTSPHYVTGRYSKVLPARLLARYQEASADAELLALREDIALVDARLADLLGRVDSGESVQAWGRVAEGLGLLRAAIAQGDAGGLRGAVSALEAAVKQGQADYAAWDEVGKTLDRRARLVEGERRRLVEMQQMLSAEQAMTLLAAVADVIRRHVTERAALAAISAELVRLMAGPAGAVAHAEQSAGSA